MLSSKGKPWSYHAVLLVGHYVKAEEMTFGIYILRAILTHVYHRLELEHHDITLYLNQPDREWLDEYGSIEVCFECFGHFLSVAILALGGRPMHVSALTTNLPLRLGPTRSFSLLSLFQWADYVQTHPDVCSFWSALHNQKA